MHELSRRRGAQERKVWGRYKGQIIQLDSINLVSVQQFSVLACWLLFIAPVAFAIPPSICGKNQSRIAKARSRKECFDTISKAAKAMANRKVAFPPVSAQPTKITSLASLPKRLQPNHRADSASKSAAKPKSSSACTPKGIPRRRRKFVDRRWKRGEQLGIFLATVQIVIALKKWTKRARLKRWEAANETLRETLSSIGESEEVHDIGEGVLGWHRRGSVESRNVKLRGRLMRLSVSSDDGGSSLDIQMKHYVSDIYFYQV
jgi:hypothetical protein